MPRGKRRRNARRRRNPLRVFRERMTEPVRNRRGEMIQRSGIGVEFPGVYEAAGTIALASSIGALVTSILHVRSHRHETVQKRKRK